MTKSLRTGAAALAALLALFPAGCSKKNEENAKALRPIVEEVRRVDLRDIISNTGSLEALVKLDLKSEASGRVDTILVKEGSKLKKGDILLKIDPERLQNQKEKLDLKVKKAQLNLDAAKRDYENAEKLSQYGNVSSNNLQDLGNQYELAKISLDELKLELRDIQKELGNTVIRAPMNGILTYLGVEEGSIVVSATSGNTGGTSIGTIADVSQLEVTTEVGEVDYPKIKMNMPAQISMASDPGRITSGRVTFISLSARKQNETAIANFTIRIAIDSVLPGMVPGVNVSVDLVLAEKRDVVGVPYSMVEQQRRGEKVRYQVTMADDKATRPIKVGLTDYKYYEVLEGLKEGDKVTKTPAGAKQNQRGGPGGGGFRPH